MSDTKERILFGEIEDLNGSHLLGESSQEIMLDNSTDHITLTDHMISQASRTIRIFTRDLDPIIYDRENFISECKRIALRSKYCRIEILAFESQRIIRKGHRLVELARAISSRIEIRRPGKEYEQHLQSFITFDDKGYIYRPYADRFEGTANYNDARETRQLEKFFKEVWIRSHVDPEMRSLNI
jgi:hypothetical protein